MMDAKESSCTSRVLVVGPQPPPVHGFSTITHLIGAELVKHGALLIDSKVRSAKGVLSNLFAIFCGARGGKSTVYIALSGGRAQLLDLLYGLIAAWCGAELVLHHHSTAYLCPEGASPLRRFVFRRVGQHVVLCECMADALIEFYKVDRRRVMELSNAAFMEGSGRLTLSREAQPLTVGFLSNISFEKGVLEFVRIVASMGGQVRGIIAGPVDVEIKDRFVEEIARVPEVSYIGPVYGSQKSEFFARIDLLIFPTRYRNEAEPLVVLEALGSGVPSIVYPRGCLEGYAGLPGVLVVESGREMDQVIKEIEVFLRDPAMLAQFQCDTEVGWRSIHSKARIAYAELIGRLVGRLPTS